MLKATGRSADKLNGSPVNDWWGNGTGLGVCFVPSPNFSPKTVFNKSRAELRAPAQYGGVILKREAPAEKEVLTMGTVALTGRAQVSTC
jgi:hypothetical protein